MSSNRWRAASGRGGRLPRPARSMPSTRCSMRRRPRSSSCGLGRGRGTGRRRTRGARARTRRNRRARTPVRIAGTGAAAARSHGGGRPVLASRIYVLPPGTPALSLPPALIHQYWTPEPGREAYLLAVGPGEDMAELDAAMAARKVHRIALPAGPAAGPGRNAGKLQQRRAALDAREPGRRAQRSRGSMPSRDCRQALAELALAAWVVTHVPELPVTEHFAWITGWCSAPRRLPPARGTGPARTALPAAHDARRRPARSPPRCCATRAGRGRSRQ